MSKSAPGRNAPCWCGSGRKYKKCHLAEDEKREAEENIPTLPRKDYFDPIRGGWRQIGSNEVGPDRD